MTPSQESVMSVAGCFRAHAYLRFISRGREGAGYRCRRMAGTVSDTRVPTHANSLLGDHRVRSSSRAVGVLPHGSWRPAREVVGGRSQPC
jgi:hypothetical protein